MSLRMVIRFLPDSRAAWALRVWSSSSAEASSNSVMPSTPFIGVRISWLMVARKCDFAWFAASAASLA